MKKKIIAQFLTGFFLVFICSMAHASSFKGNSIGAFSNAEGGDPQYYKYITKEDTSWFETGLKDHYNTSNWVSIQGQAFDVDVDTEFSFGKLTYYNGTNPTTPQPGAAATKVSLNIDLNFEEPVEIVEQFIYELTFNNVPNLNSNLHAWENADYLYIPTKHPLASFTFGNTEYTLEFTRFGTTDRNGQVTDLDQFHVLEGRSATANLYGKITAVTSDPAPVSSVPEPGTFVLAAFGMIGLAGVMRKYS